jgi:hypothetical protein
MKYLNRFLLELGKGAHQLRLQLLQEDRRRLRKLSIDISVIDSKLFELHLRMMQLVQK